MIRLETSGRRGIGPEIETIPTPSFTETTVRGRAFWEFLLVF
ncbi:MAG: hypothetical protein WCS65_02640 [Verrucomicrobiae bacterium]